MKKILTFFLTGAAVVALCAACSNEESKSSENQEQGQSQEQIQEGEIPVEVDDKVATFFNENATLVAWHFFDDGNGLPRVEGCVLINNADELPEVLGFDGLPLEYPDIDFNTHTLVVGQWIGGGSLYLASQSVVAEQGKATINLVIRQHKEEGFDYHTGIFPNSFWGIYPKITAKTIAIVAT